MSIKQENRGMKVIVTGATCTIGRGVPKQCIIDPRVSSIFVLTQKQLPSDLTSSAKVKEVLHQDFKTYSASLLKELAGAEG